MPREHDPEVCGLFEDMDCDQCRKPAAVRSLVGDELRRIAEKFSAAQARSRRAAALTDKNDAEGERLDAQGEYRAARLALADLLLLMLRAALEHREDALRLYLADLLKPELEPLADALAKLEGRR